MSVPGIDLTVLIGRAVPAPMPPPLSENLQRVEVTHSDQGRSGFQITFGAGRSGPADLLDYKLMLLPLLRPFNRVVLIVTIGALPQVLMDGVITNQQLNPGDDPGATTLTVTGEDLSLLMDMKEKNVEHPAQPDLVIANKILATYALHGIVPAVIPPPSLDVPLPIERTPVQRGTDLQYLQQMAERYGYVFFVRPGPAPLTSIGYWGPPVREGVPQKALSVNVGADTNVTSINFQYDALGPKTVSGKVKDRLTDTTLPVQTFFSTRVPLVSQPALPFNLPDVRDGLLGDVSGLNYLQAFMRAQGETNESMDNVATANGELDALRYGGVLEPRALVGLRGAGFHHDGFYYVKRVTHSIGDGQYTQQFSLSREGQGALSPVVPV